MRSILRAAAVCALASLATLSCAQRDHATNPILPMWAHRPSWALHLGFRKLLVADQGTSAKTGVEKGVPGIDVRHGRVFVGTSDHGLYAVRAGDGSVIWRFQTAGAVQSEPLYDDERDIVFFGSDDDGMYAVRGRDGALLWRYRTGAEVQRRPVLVPRPNGKATLVFDNAADGVFACDAETGAPKWKRLRTPALGLEIAGHAGVAYADERVYAAFSTGRVVAYDIETGKDRWQEVDLTATGGAGADEQQQYFDVDTTPVVVGDRVYVASIAAGVFGLDATTGLQVWRRPEAEGVSWVTHWSEPAHVDSYGVDVPERALLLAGSGTTGLWALDPKTGDVRWRRKGPRGTLAFPVQIGGALLASSSKLGLFLFDPLQGYVIDGIDPGTGFAGGAAAHGNRAFILTNAGVLLGIDLVPPTRPPTNAKSW